jgi:8-oxo-dGDP phosphatase
MQPWQILKRRTIYDSDWMRLQLVDLRLPDGTVAREIHMVDYPHQAAGVVPVRADGQILLIDHYRFQTETRGWEIPAGRIETGEEPVEAVARELREETGHQAHEFVALGRYHPSNGSSNQVFHIFAARGVEQTGAVEDTNEVLGWQWFPPMQVRELIARNAILDGLSLTGLLWYFELQVGR